MRLKLVLLITLFATNAYGEEVVAEEQTTTASEEKVFTPPLTQKLREVERAILYSADSFDINNSEKNNWLPMTKALISDIAAQQQKSKNINCQGIDIPGELCGLGYSPILCAQDVSDIYFYKVENETDNNLTVYSSTRESGADANRYKFVFEQNEWKINSISCYNSDSFNDW